MRFLFVRVQDGFCSLWTTGFCFVLRVAVLTKIEFNTSSESLLVLVFPRDLGVEGSFRSRHRNSDVVSIAGVAFGVFFDMGSCGF